MTLAQRPGGPGPPRGGLRLRAEDAEDLAVISACLQDALVAVRDLAYDRDSLTFALAANRFCWEAGGADGGRESAPFARTLCLIAFDGVAAVAYRGFQRREDERILSLLAIEATPARADARAAAAGTVITLEFAGGATIRLSAAGVRCRARDCGEPWPTRWQPGHSLDDPP